MILNMDGNNQWSLTIQKHSGYSKILYIHRKIMLEPSGSFTLIAESMKNVEKGTDQLSKLFVFHKLLKYNPALFEFLHFWM